MSHSGGLLLGIKMSTKLKTYWAKFNDEGFPLAFYVSDIWPTQPEDTVEITEEQWQEFINNQGLRIWNGEEVIVYDPPTLPSILVVTPRQARLALLNAGLLEQVESLVDSIGGATKITWEYATEVRSDDPLIISLAAQVPLTEQQLIDLFEEASDL